MGRRPFPDEDEKPWSEEEWLADMKRNDARADRFGELLETLRDHPDRDARVAREMGWDQLADRLDEQRGAVPPFEPSDEPDESDEDEDDVEDDEDDEDDEEEPTTEEFEAWAEESDPEDHDEPEPRAVQHPSPEALLAEAPPIEAEEEDDEDEETFMRREPARDIAEYRYTMRLGLKFHHMLKPYADGDADDDPTDGLLGQALIGPHIASAKIVGGHSLGYSKHYVNGNIACQRIGLDAVDKSIRAYEQLKADGFLPAEFVDSILPQVRRMRGVLADRIERLRAYARSLHAVDE